MSVNQIPAAHAEHDQILVAALAAGDLAGEEQDMATALTASCADCAGLLGDLRLIAPATAMLPAPRRARDFRLTEADASRLRARGWRRLLGSFASPRLAFTGPLAAALTTLGIAGLLLATVPSALFQAGSAGAPAALSSVGASGSNAFAPSAAPAPAPAVAPSLEAAPTASGLPRMEEYSRSASSPGAGSTELEMASPAEKAAQRSLASEQAPSGPGVPPLLVASAGLLVAGLGLFGLRWGARRLARR